MAFLFRVLIGLAVVAGGVFMVMRTGFIVDFVGPIPWAEEKIGTGGTTLFYKLLGVLVIFIGFVVATNLWNALLGATLGSLFR